MRKEESFPIPLKYIDVISSTHTGLDVAQEKRIDDNWNVDRFVDGLHKIDIIERNSSEDFCGPVGDGQKSRRHHVQITFG